MEQSAQIQQDDFSHFQLIQQPAPRPVTLFQQLPSAMPPPAPTFRPGHIREDLVELMMMQNAQMHQVIMNNMTMSALSSFGYMQAPELNTEHLGAHVRAELDPEVYHHHYPCPPCVSYPVWTPIPQPQVQSHVPLQTIPSFQDPTYPLHNVHVEHRDGKAPPLSATGTAGPDVPPAAEYYDADRRQHSKKETQN